MANYSKKRPVFKSKAESYKKSRWIKLKEAISYNYSNLNRWFAKIFYKINEKGSQRLTVMFVPHSEKKIINIQISNYILFFFSIVLAVTIVTSSMAITNNQQIQNQYVILKQENDLKMRQIDDYKRRIEDIDNNFANIKDEIKNIIKPYGKNVYNYNIMELDNLDIVVSNRVKSPEVKILKKLKYDLEITTESAVRLGKFIEEWEDLLYSIPSKYPLPFRTRVSSRFGIRVNPFNSMESEFHPGIDFAVLSGTPILASADGDVSIMGWVGNYGLMVEVKHKYGFSTRYSHMLSFAPGIGVGTRVMRGQTIGYVGTTGRSTGNHLYYEIRIGDKIVDPEPYTAMTMP